MKIKINSWCRILSNYSDINEGLHLIHTENITSIPSNLLPTPPDDITKYSYIDTNRKFIVSFGLLSVIPLSIGLWLFAYVELFYIPISLLTTGYLLVSYLGVALWGRDMKIEEHNELINTSCPKYCPSIDVFLPCCNECMDILNNTYNYVSKLDYPNFNVYVLDDGNRPYSVKSLCEEYDFNYIRRPDIGYMKKAGNLRNAFAQTSGELILILDADFCPRSDFLKETVPYFQKDPQIAILQTPQYFNVLEEQNWIERASGSIQELFYRLIQQNRQIFGSAICVGSCAVYRREALEPFGGTALVNASEDVHTGFNVVNAGWTLKYLPLVLSTGTCPDTLKAFFAQTYRWASGSIMLTTNRDFWKSNLTFNQKVCYLTGGLYYVSTAISIFTYSFPSIILVALRPELVLWYNVIYAVPSTIFPFVIMRIWNTQKYGLPCIRIRYVQYVAHFSAIFDHITKNQMAWIPTASTQINSNRNERYHNGLAMLLYSTILQFVTLYSLCFYRMNKYNFYNFIPSMILESINTFIILQVFFK
jgi:cellulose synthase/poly-beta-1,6-N-acetylglucosamine synthase-like glycosyltransferase